MRTQAINNRVELPNRYIYFICDSNKIDQYPVVHSDANGYHHPALSDGHVWSALPGRLAVIGWPVFILGNFYVV